MVRIKKLICLVLAIVLCISLSMVETFNVQAATYNIYNVKGITWNIKAGRAFSYETYIDGVGFVKQKAKISAIKKISNTGKTISNNNSTTNYIKNGSELKFKLVFGETLDVSGVDTSKIKLSGANGSLIIDSVTETECIFTIKGGTGNGKINITINEGFLTDEFGNKSVKSTAIEKSSLPNTSYTVWYYYS